MLKLPYDFLDEMKEILKDDYGIYEKTINDEPFRGISVNRLKTDKETVKSLLPFEVKESPFYEESFYIPCDEQGIGKLPLHHAGGFYVQEPSAASAVSLLDVQKGDRVLDLCAAPGGKSAQIGSLLCGTGLLWSNEVVKSRSQILLSNFERMGISKGVVSSCYPEVLCERLSGFFDRVLVDAPCSGEGMFRKNPSAVSEWSREHVIACAERQLSILKSASKAVKKGGTLVYSTCTFSYEENEGVIKRFLSECPDFETAEINEPFGRKTELPCAVRITPVEGGEGHFAAKLKRKGETEDETVYYTAVKNSDSDLIRLAEKELSGIFYEIPNGVFYVVGDKLFILPENLPDIKGLGVIRAGVLAGEFRKKRFEPAHALFMSAKTDNVKRVLNLSGDDKRISDFLSGFEIDCDCENGYTAAAYHGIILGFGKTSDQRLKNKYPKGLRINP